jgi:uncharacterized protein (DUF302 family)
VNGGHGRGRTYVDTVVIHWVRKKVVKNCVEEIRRKVKTSGYEVKIVHKGKEELKNEWYTRSRQYDELEWGDKGLGEPNTN